jgi:hypothetical protein
MQLDEIVPWGRSLAEYQAMFNLTPDDLSKHILGCGDGPASFNAELNQQGGNVVSVDPLYQFSQQQIHQRILEVAPQIIAEVSENQDDFVWQHIRSPLALRALRLHAMDFFLDDYELGQKTGRYLNQQLPKLELNDLQFELALCSHFLFLYSDHLSLEFHQHALFELARVAKEVRIYPLVTLSNQNSPYLDPCMKALIKAGFAVTLEQSQYEFQRGATEMLTIKALT